MSSLKSLENESLSIISETLKHAENPLVLYSIGKRLLSAAALV